MVKFAYTILYVQDVTKAIEFYERAFGLTRKFVTPVNDYGELLVGETTLSFSSTSLAKANLKDGFTESSFNAGATIVENSKTKPWGQVVAYLRDLDGFLIEVCTPMN